MTRRALALYAAGALTAACAILAAEVALWPLAALLILAATALYGAADRHRDQARAHEKAARPPGPHIPTWAPCCDYWIHSAGMTHNPRECTRSSA